MIGCASYLTGASLATKSADVDQRQADARAVSRSPVPRRTGRSRGQESHFIIRGRAGGRMMRVLLADDEPLAVERLHRGLATVPGIEVIGVAADGVETCEKIAALR